MLTQLDYQNRLDPFAELMNYLSGNAPSRTVCLAQGVVQTALGAPPKARVWAMIDGEEGMGTLLESVAVAPTGLSLALVEEIEAARQYRQRAKAVNTTRAYASDWAKFEGWCWERNLEPLPASAEVVATYLSARAGNAPSTITRHLAAIGWRHRHA